jgi:putative resolvase
MNSKLLTLQQTSDILGISKKTLRIWDDEGKLISIRTIGGHRRYKEEDVLSFLKESNAEPIQTNITATYSRVSSHEQKTKGDLDRQSQRLSEYCAKKKLTIEYIIKDVGSGLSDTRTGFIKLTNLVIKGQINKVVIEHKDRLTRFQYNFIEKMFNSYNVEIIHTEKNDVSEHEDLATDLISIIASFSGRLYGKRSGERRRNKKENKLN